MANDGDIAILGAAGQTGLATIAAVAARGAPVRAVVHRDEQAAVVAAAGARTVRTAELSEPGTITAALEGAGAVLFVPPVFSTRETEFARNACAAARAAGVERFVLHSVLHAHTPSMPHHMRKAASEAAVRASGLRWTILQPSMYAQTPMIFIRARSEGRVPVPFDPGSRFTVIDLDDLAEITARVLLEDGHDYAGYELVGTEAQTIDDYVAEASTILGETLSTTRVTPWSLPLPPAVERGMASMAAMCDEYDAHGLLGNAGVATWLLGRPPASFSGAGPPRRALSPA
jgi:NAD(P)H dehydrogenase (quinone)